MSVSTSMAENREAAASFGPAGQRRALWRIDWIAVPRLHVAILCVLCLLLSVFLAGNIQHFPESSDSRTNFEVGVNFGETGVFGPTPDYVGWHMREPLVPFLVGAYHVARKTLGLETAPPECTSFDAQKTPECMAATAPYRHVNVAFVVLAAVSSFLLVYGTLGAAIPAYAAFAASGTSAMLLNGLQRFMTEGPAAALMALSAVLVCALLARRRLWLAVALGACLAALTLTKIVFAYFWVVVGAGLLALAFSERRTGYRLAIHALVMALVYLGITGAWMTRNYMTADQFKLMDGRSYRVLSVRSSYNEMRLDEWLAGFVYFLPLFDEARVLELGIGPGSIERFDSGNENSFRRVGQERYRVARREEIAKAKADGIPAPFDRYVYEQLTQRFSRLMLSDPVAHLRVTVLLAYLATFPETGQGFPARARYGRESDDWPIPVPSPGLSFGPAGVTFINAATTVAILALPFVLFLRNRNVGGLVIALPVLYSHGVYAVASHFIVRYARPEIPLRNVALIILIWLLVAGAIGLARRPRGKRSPGTTPAEAV